MMQNKWPFCLVLAVTIVLGSTPMGMAEGRPPKYRLEKEATEKKLLEKRRSEERVTRVEQIGKEIDLTKRNNEKTFSASELLSKFETRRDQKAFVNTKAAEIYTINPKLVEGRDRFDVEKEFDRNLRDVGGWEKQSLRDGNGVRYFDNKGGSVQLNYGYPEGLKGGQGDVLHKGPYVKIGNGQNRIPLKGNPILY